MKVKLISHSQTPIDIIHDANDYASALDLVAFCARVSNPSNQMNKETSQKLVKYLIKHKHWSPLEMVSVCMEIETTRDIARQLLRHRSFSFQEFSQRYADPTDIEENPFELREARLQDPKNRQNSIPCEDEYIMDRWENEQLAVIERAKQAYKWAIDHGIAKEQARAVLPEGNTLSRVYVNGTLRSWIHFIDLRSANGTQLEHMELAKECGKVIKEIFPLDNN
jgi:thymidylate synthase (FAD)